MGSSACYHFAKRGVKVLGIEQYKLGHSMGSSHGKTRIIKKGVFRGGALGAAPSPRLRSMGRAFARVRKDSFAPNGPSHHGPHSQRRRGRQRLAPPSCEREEAQHHPI